MRLYRRAERADPPADAAAKVAGPNASLGEPAHDLGRTGPVGAGHEQGAFRDLPGPVADLADLDLDQPAGV
jgi:hypothetical protein